MLYHNILLTEDSLLTEKLFGDQDNTFTAMGSEVCAPGKRIYYFSNFNINSFVTHSPKVELISLTTEPTIDDQIITGFNGIGQVNGKDVYATKRYTAPLELDVGADEIVKAIWDSVQAKEGTGD